MTVEALNCPNCGAGVSSDSTQCEFCKTRLKTMACPSCFGVMFIGSKFCGHCGAKAVQAAVDEDADPGECPRCSLRLDRLQIGDTALRECHKCCGLWSDPETFENVCADRERQSTVLGFMGKRESAVKPLSQIKYVPCPDCKQLMNRSNFARASGVIIDSCKQHGIWFDAEELPRIIEFIQKGGMEIARQREKNELDQERMRLNEERRKLGALARGTGLDDFSIPDNRDVIKHFIRNLFD